jgi:hypothetical protein
MPDETKSDERKRDESKQDVVIIPRWILGIAACTVILAIILAAVGCAIYDMGRNEGYTAGVASVPTPAPTPVPTPVPAPAPVINTPVSYTGYPAAQVPTIDYINDVQSFGTQYGYVCLVDGNGNEYLIENFDVGTAELLQASYSGTVVSTYNGIPMLENVALTAYPPQQNTVYYYSGSYYAPSDTGHYIRTVNYRYHRIINSAPPGYNIPGEPARFWTY